MATLPNETAALIDWQDGQPVSRRYGDRYFSRDSGLEETRHVFLDGNRLRERWSVLPRHARFTIGETGFGSGLNFVAAWCLWDELAPAGACLRYISVEQDPLVAADIARTLGLWPELAPYAEALLAQWSALPPGWHRFVLGGGRCCSRLPLATSASCCPRLDATVDAWFLDGFAPAKNPAMWQPEVSPRSPALRPGRHPLDLYRRRRSPAWTRDSRLHGPEVARVRPQARDDARRARGRLPRPARTVVCAPGLRGRGEPGRPS